MSARARLPLLAVCAALLAAPAAAQDSARAAYAEATGHAERETAFDRVRLGFRFVAESRESGPSTKDVADRLSASAKALEGEGVAGADIEVEGPRTQIKYAQSREGARRIDGYETQGAVFVTTSDLTSVSKLATLMVGRGAAMDEPGYFVAKQAEAERDLAAEAARDGVAQARRLIEAVGAKPGRILFIGEPGGGGPRPMDFALRKAAAPSLDIPVRPGKALLTKSVVVRVEILAP